MTRHHGFHGEKRQTHIAPFQRCTTRRRSTSVRPERRTRPDTVRRDVCVLAGRGESRAENRTLGDLRCVPVVGGDAECQQSGMFTIASSLVDVSDW